jgi:hypothetical protein
MYSALLGHSIFHGNMAQQFMFTEFHIFGSKLLMSGSRNEKVTAAGQETDTRGFMSADGF